MNLDQNYLLQVQKKVTLALLSIHWYSPPTIRWEPSFLQLNMFQHVSRSNHSSMFLCLFKESNQRKGTHLFLRHTTCSWERRKLPYFVAFAAHSSSLREGSSPVWCSLFFCSWPNEGKRKRNYANDQIGLGTIGYHQFSRFYRFPSGLIFKFLWANRTADTTDSQFNRSV